MNKPARAALWREKRLVRAMGKQTVKGPMQIYECSRCAAAFGSRKGLYSAAIDMGWELREGRLVCDRCADREQGGVSGEEAEKRYWKRLGMGGVRHGQE